MTTEAPQSSPSSNHIFNPPTLPAHLSGIYGLKPIVGHPNDEDVKAIHAAIRAVNAEAQVPHLYNPDLSLQLSQHLFNVQMAIYRKAYPISLFPGEHTYTPPSLPAHIPIALEPVVGTPTREKLKAVQNVIRVAESLGSSPLFDPDLNMDLSQHLFNLQFARYIQSSTLGQFDSKSEEAQNVSHHPQLSQLDLPTPQNTSANPPAENSCDIGPGPRQSTILETEGAQRSALDELGRHEPPVSSEIAQLGADIHNMKEIMSDSKRVLENINRVLVATQRNPISFGRNDRMLRAHINPVNQQGITATESGLPQLHYTYSFNNSSCNYDHCTPEQLARYLKFLEIDTDLIEGDGEPRVNDSNKSQAAKLIFQRLGIA